MLDGPAAPDQHALHFPRQIGRRLVESHGAQRVEQPVERKRERDLGGTDIARAHQNVENGKIPVVVHVLDGSSPDPVDTRRGIHHRVHADLAAFQGHGHGKRLGRGARFHHVGHGAVPKHPRPDGAPVIGIELRRRHHGEDLAAGNGQHHHAAPGSLVFLDGFLQVGGGQELHPLVDTDPEIFPVADLLDALHAFDIVSRHILEYPLAARNARQMTVEPALQTLLAGVVHIGKSNQVGADGAIGVIAPVLPLPLQPGNVERHDLLRHGRRNSPPDIHEIGTLSALACGLEVTGVQFQDIRHGFPGISGGAEHAGLSPQRLHRGTYCQHLPVSVQDLAALGQHGDFPQVSGVALGMEMAPFHGLDMHHLEGNHDQPR